MTDECSEEESDDKVTEVTEHPSDWIFKGFSIFYYFGHFSENRVADRYIDLLQLADPPKKGDKKISRNNQRKEVAAAEAFDHTCD